MKGFRMGEAQELVVEATLAGEPVRKVHRCSITDAGEAPKRKSKDC